MSTYTFDVLIIGSGAAGLSTALHLPATTRIGILSKDILEAGATHWAQGGVAAVLSEADTIDSHIEDTLVAGAGLCDLAAVKQTVENAAEAIHWLAALGVPFTTQADLKQRLHLTKEGGHTHRRIVHAEDATGLAIHTTLLNQAKARPNIQFFAHHMAIDLVIANKQDLSTREAQGLYALNIQSDDIETFAANFIVLATGGAGKAYLYTSNPDVASGDGIAMAWRAGCTIQDMEFNQFHPTCLYHPNARSFLLTEAIRGEGGYLRLPNGERFMHRFDARLELAPRDIVARAIDHEMKRLGLDCLYLDISHQPAAFIQERFPTLYAQCLKYGFDMTKEPLPIVPAAHYTCGGVKTDLWGRTDISRLYAIGETASTGLHGANRLASNSILECLVFGKQAAIDIQRKCTESYQSPAIRPWDDSQVCDPDERVVLSHNWEELRRFMWDYVGIVRTTKRLLRAQHRVDLLKQEIQDFYSHFKMNADLIELRNLVAVADLMIQSALSRHESRGLHFTLDYPETLKKAVHTQLCPISKPIKHW